MLGCELNELVVHFFSIEVVNNVVVGAFWF